MQNIIGYLITTAILSFISGLVLKESKQHGRSLKKFTVQVPRAYCKTIVIVGFVVASLLPIAFLYNGLMGFGWNLDSMAVKFVVGFEIIVIAIDAVYSFWRLDVNGDDIIYRSFHFTTRRFNIHDLTELRQGDEWVSLYTKNGRIAVVSNESVGLSNLLSRCKKEEIPVLPGEQRFASKWVLLVHSMHNIFILDVVILVIIVLASFLGDRSIKEELAFGFGFGLLFIAVFTIVLTSIFILKGMRLIRVQEKVLGFSFDEEMRRLNIHGKTHIDEDWYITADIPTITLIALNRRFIKSISEINKNRNSSESTGYKLEIGGVDGKTYKIEFWSKAMMKNIMDWWQK
jgi:hypothetical protein